MLKSIGLILLASSSMLLLTCGREEDGPPMPTITVAVSPTTVETGSTSAEITFTLTVTASGADGIPEAQGMRVFYTINDEAPNTSSSTSIDFDQSNGKVVDGKHIYTGVSTLTLEPGTAQVANTTIPLRFQATADYIIKTKKTGLIEQGTEETQQTAASEIMKQDYVFIPATEEVTETTTDTTTSDTTTSDTTTSDTTTSDTTTSDTTTSDTTTSDTTTSDTTTTVSDPAPPASLAFTDTDTDVAQLGGTLTITKASDESGNANYVLYWGSSATAKVSGQSAIATIAVTGADISYSVAANTSIPSGATHILGYGVSSGSTESSSLAVVSLTDVSSGAIVMYTSNTGYTGNLGGRSGADTICSSAKSSILPLLSCSNQRAFISIDSSDEIRDMPTNYSVSTSLPIVGPTGTTIGTNWADLLDDSISKSMVNAGVIDDSPALDWWSGSESDGSLDSSNNCSGFASNSGFGQRGLRRYTNAFWLDGNSTFSCTASFSAVVVLCLCY